MNRSFITQKCLKGLEGNELVMVKVYAKTMTYYVLLLSIIFVVGVLGFSSNHSPIYGGLGLIVSGGVWFVGLF